MSALLSWARSFLVVLFSLFQGYGGILVGRILLEPPLLSSYQEQRRRKEGRNSQTFPSPKVKVLHEVYILHSWGGRGASTQDGSIEILVRLCLPVGCHDPQIFNGSIIRETANSRVPLLLLYSAVTTIPVMCRVYAFMTSRDWGFPPFFHSPLALVLGFPKICFPYLEHFSEDSL